MLIFVLILALAVLLLFPLMLRGRSGHPRLKKLRSWAYAHRGLHGNGLPENSVAAFRAAVEHGYGAELDVHLLADGGLAVIHDSTLIRTTGDDGRIEDLTTDQLELHFLEKTGETIPKLTEVLKLFDGKAPLVIELKVEKNAKRLCEAVAKVLDDYKGLYCIESFHPQAVAWFRKHRPDVVRGQLTENFFRSKLPNMPGVVKFILTNLFLNVWTRPDFVAYRFEDRKNLSNAICRGLWKMQGAAWTIRSQADYDVAVRDGWMPIFENFKP